MKNPSRFLNIAAILAASLCFTASARAGGGEYTGTFEAELATNTESTQRIIFKNIPPERLKGQITFSANAHVSAAKLYDPTRESLAILAMIVEEPSKLPMIFVDLNNDKSFGNDEKFPFKDSAKYRDLYEIKINVPIKGNFYNSFPTIIQFFKGQRTAKMSADDCLVEQSDEAFARGAVDLKGKRSWCSIGTIS
jgi:hypothetical protein